MSISTIFTETTSGSIIVELTSNCFIIIVGLADYVQLLILLLLLSLRWHTDFTWSSAKFLLTVCEMTCGSFAAVTAPCNEVFTDLCFVIGWRHEALLKLLVQGQKVMIINTITNFHKFRDSKKLGEWPRLLTSVILV